MNFDHEVVIIGDGPAGISFFNRFKALGKEALLITTSNHLEHDDIYSRFSLFDPDSPKTWKFLNSTNVHITTQAISSLSDSDKKFKSVEYFGVGGLSNRWGAGCAKLNSEDLGVNNDLLNRISGYYDEAEKEVGIYYHGEDLLDDYLGKFKKAEVELNTPKSLHFSFLKTNWSKIGRTRQAFLQKEKGERKPCNNCGGCFIFCQNKTIYNAKFLLTESRKEIYESNKVVALSKVGSGYSLRLMNTKSSNFFDIKAKIVVLAAGTLGSTRLLSMLINHPLSTDFHHNMIVRSVFFGARREKKNNFPTGQYIVKTEIDESRNAYTSLTHGTSIPTSDIVDLLPIKNHLTYSLVNFFKNYLVVALTFYPSEYSNYKIQIGSGKFNFLHMGISPKFKLLNEIVIGRLKGIMSINRLYTLPLLGSILPQGSDIHYGGTIPIGPKQNVNCTEDCEIRGHHNLYVIDGSWMPRIPEKPHTFTIIANAMRVADCVALRLKE